MHRLICWSLLAFASLWCACQSDYEKMVARETSRDVQIDSLFLGFYFGMPQDSFFNYCWARNQSGLFHHGAETDVTSVGYYPGGFSKPVVMNFFPRFENRKIASMWATFRYRDWAPWNKELFSEPLRNEISPLLERWFGSGFLALKTPEGAPFWVKVEANRQVLITLPNDSQVRLEITDLSKAKNKM